MFALKKSIVRVNNKLDTPASRRENNRFNHSLAVKVNF